MQAFVTLNQALIMDDNLCEVDNSSTRGKHQLKAKRGPIKFERKFHYSHVQAEENYTC